MAYSADCSDIHILASNLSKRWKEKYSKTMAELGLTAPHMIKDNKLTSEERRTFAKNLYKLSKDELGILLMQLSVEKSPAAAISTMPQNSSNVRHN
jgi:hypothetical protein